MPTTTDNPSDSHLTETVSVRMSLPAVRLLVQRAQAENRTLSNFVRTVLERFVHNTVVAK